MIPHFLKLKAVFCFEVENNKSKHTLLYEVLIIFNLSDFAYIF